MPKRTQEEKKQERLRKKESSRGQFTHIKRFLFVYEKGDKIQWTAAGVSFS